MILGAQLFTVRQHCYTLDDFAETLKKIADIGYTEVQVSGTCDYTGEWLDRELKKNGLTCHLTHFNFDRTVNDTQAVIDLHKQIGCPNIGLGAMPGWGEENGYESFVGNTVLRDAIKKINGAGLRYTYHHHGWEYEKKLADGKNILRHLAEEFSADELCFTLDTYWVLDGKASIEEETEYLSGRLPCVHFKDMFTDESGKNHMTWCGGGNRINFGDILPLFEKAGTEYVYVEQDDCGEEDPFVCLSRSYDYLKSLGLE